MVHRDPLTDACNLGTEIGNNAITSCVNINHSWCSSKFNSFGFSVGYEIKSRIEMLWMSPRSPVVKFNVIKCIMEFILFFG